MAGTGNVVKLVTNQLWFIHAASTARVRLGMANGVELPVLYDAICDWSVTRRARHDGPSIFGLRRPELHPRLCLKDLGLVRERKTAHAPLTTTAAAHEVFKDGMGTAETLANSRRQAAWDTTNCRSEWTVTGSPPGTSPTPNRSSIRGSMTGPGLQVVVDALALPAHQRKGTSRGSSRERHELTRMLRRITDHDPPSEVHDDGCVSGDHAPEVPDRGGSADHDCLNLRADYVLIKVFA